MADSVKPRLIDSGPAVRSSGLVHRVLEPSADLGGGFGAGGAGGGFGAGGAGGGFGAGGSGGGGGGGGADGVGGAGGSGGRPTALLLHGQRGDEDSMWVFARALPKGWLAVAPRAPETDPVDGYAWRHRDADEWPTLADFDAAAHAIERFASSLPELYGAAPERITVIGFSQGAAAAVAAAIAKPDLFRGLASLVGFVPTECGDELAARQPLVDLPVFMAIGRQDELVPVERARASAETLRCLGASVEAHEYDVGHKLTTQGIRDLQSWLAGLAQA